MLTEILPGRASNGVALNNLMRNVLSCIAAIVTEPLIQAIGVHWFVYRSRGYMLGKLSYNCRYAEKKPGLDGGNSCEAGKELTDNC